MAKVTLTDLTSLANDTSAVNSINNNFQTLEDALNDDVLYRNNPVGETNTMMNDLDMNSFDILNGGSARFTTLTVDGVTASGGNTFSDANWLVNISDDSSFDVADGNVHQRTATGNETIDITLSTEEFSIMFVNYIPGAHTIAFGTTIDEWVGGIVPSVIEANHWFAFWSIDGGVTIIGQTLGGSA